MSEAKNRASSKNARSLGRYVVADPRICHGKPTFRGTRVFVSDVLQQVASGMDWESIIEEWNGNITKEAIGEAVELARHALLNHAEDLALDALVD